MLVRKLQNRSERSATIAANFLIGYQEGLEIDNSLDDGVDPFGMQHTALRSWAGTILAPHIEGITNSLQMPDGHGFSLRAPQSNDGYLINLSADLTDRIIGNNGLFTDLAFDKGLDGREGAITTLKVAANAGFKEDMDYALAHGNPGGLQAAQNKWAPIMNDLALAPPGASEQATAAIVENREQWNSMIQKGIGMIPFGNIIGEGHDVAKWLIDQSKGIVFAPGGPGDDECLHHPVPGSRIHDDHRRPLREGHLACRDGGPLCAHHRAATSAGGPIRRAGLCRGDRGPRDSRMGG